ncbi:nitrite reductase [Thiovibrio frasassiensis]|uniref:Nitrite reductase n=1 Tax=Thiovibrio frasassiensis TaxID=2984131 RepID=A0A9X4MGY2_9BACT|nr:nitrite reductase [Thiovibrio frasassiensis]MDG4474634.1 nitrite reductase [Thiovibrio frasassiensis]
MTNTITTTRLTILLPAGRLPLAIMDKANALAQKYQLELYLSTAQNLRLMGIKEEDLPAIREELAALGAQFKGPGKFPIPRVCIGVRDCSMGVGDPERISALILAKFQGREKTKQKFKIAISGCTLACSGVLTTDIGIMATRKGFDLFVGGKGGPSPKVGRRVLRDLDEQGVVAAVAELVEFHDAHTETKQRMVKLIDHPEFPFKEVV